MNPSEKRHSPTLVASNTATAGDRSRAMDAPSRRVGLAWLDELALTRLVDGEAGGLLEWVRDSATSLTGADKNDARIRLLARAIATERARMSMLEAMLDECIVNRDKGVEMLDRVLSSTVKRLVTLCGEHRLACGQGQRNTVVAVAHADEVHIDGGE